MITYILRRSLMTDDGADKFLWKMYINNNRSNLRCKWTFNRDEAMLFNTKISAMHNMFLINEFFERRETEILVYKNEMHRCISDMESL